MKTQQLGSVLAIVERLWWDLRFSMRRLGRQPRFALVVVLTLALGIGASSAVFNVVRGVLLASLPYAEPDRIVRLVGHRHGHDEPWGTISYPNFSDVRKESRSFSAMAAYDEWDMMLRLDRPMVISGASVNPEFFDVLGVRPALGRGFLPGKGQAGAAASVIISHGLWSRLLDSDPAVIGRTLNLSGNPYTVVGVLPPNFLDPDLSGERFDAPQVWRPAPPYFEDSSRSGRSFTAIGRLQPGVSLDAAAAEVRAIMAGLELAYPEQNSDRTMRVRSLEDDLLGSARSGLWLLFGAVGLLMLIACANVANLMLVRASHLKRELGIRSTLGAARWLIGRQILLECLVLATIGGLLGIAIAYLATSGLHGLFDAAIPRPVPVVMDWPVLAFAAGVSTFAAVAASILPILATSEGSISLAIKERDNASGSRRLAGQMRWLVGVQMALTLALVLTTVLLARSFVNLANVDPGIDADAVMTLQVAALSSDYPEHKHVTALYADVLRRVAAVPGVDAIGAIDILPFSGGFNGNSFVLLDRPEPAAGDRSNAETRSVTPGFVRAARIELVEGRFISDSDRLDTRRVVVVNEAFAERYFPGASPLGARMALFGEEWAIVGVVGNVHQFALDRAPETSIYIPHLQSPNQWMRRNMTLFVRGAGDVMRLAPDVRTAIWSVAPDVAIENVRRMEAVMQDTFSHDRFRTTLLTAFAGAALLLGAVGLYGVVAYAVAQRTREVGIRMALGGRSSQLVRMMVLQGMWPAVLGGAAGLVIGLFIAQALRGLLFGVSPTDPITIVAAAAVLGATGVAACWLPARQAARVEPMQALRQE